MGGESTELWSRSWKYRHKQTAEVLFDRALRFMGQKSVLREKYCCQKSHWTWFVIWCICLPVKEKCVNDSWNAFFFFFFFFSLKEIRIEIDNISDGVEMGEISDYCESETRCVVIYFRHSEEKLPCWLSFQTCEVVSVRQWGGASGVEGAWHRGGEDPGTQSDQEDPHINEARQNPQNMCKPLQWVQCFHVCCASFILAMMPNVTGGGGWHFKIKVPWLIITLCVFFITALYEDRWCRILLMMLSDCVFSFFLIK